MSFFGVFFNLYFILFSSSTLLVGSTFSVFSSFFLSEHFSFVLVSSTSVHQIWFCTCWASNPKATDVPSCVGAHVLRGFRVPILHYPSSCYPLSLLVLYIYVCRGGASCLATPKRVGELTSTQVCPPHSFHSFSSSSHGLFNLKSCFINFLPPHLVFFHVLTLILFYYLLIPRPIIRVFHSPFSFPLLPFISFFYFFSVRVRMFRLSFSIRSIPPLFFSFFPVLFSVVFGLP